MAAIASDALRSVARVIFRQPNEPSVLVKVKSARGELTGHQINQEAIQALAEQLGDEASRERASKDTPKGECSE